MQAASSANILSCRHSAMHAALASEVRALLLMRPLVMADTRELMPEVIRVATLQHALVSSSVILVVAEGEMMERIEGDRTGRDRTG